jgi:hypothetical protein
MFENFYKYIKEIYGNFKLKLRISPDALVWCYVYPQYSLLHGVRTSFLETVPITIGSCGDTKTVAYEVPILKRCADNLTIKSVNNVYTKRITQLNSYGRACNNVISAGSKTVTTLTNNLVGFCSSGHTNVTLTRSNWEITRAEIVIAGYIIHEKVLAALKSILKKRPLLIPV